MKFFTLRLTTVKGPDDAPRALYVTYYSHDHSIAGVYRGDISNAQHAKAYKGRSLPVTTAQYSMLLAFSEGYAQ